MSVELAGSALSRALGLTDKQIKFLLRTGWVIALSMFMLWASGALAFAGIGVSPFASASEVARLNQDVTGIKVQLLEQTLFDVRLRQCKAESTESRQYYYERLQEKMNDYFYITGRNWQPPACEEIS